MKNLFRFSAFSLVLILCLTLIPFSAGANPSTAVKVGGKDVTAGGYWTYRAGAWGDGSSENYNVAYAPGTETLTLKDFSYSGTGEDENNIGLYADRDLTVSLVGENQIRIENREEGNEAFGIFTSGALVLAGSGSLTVTAGDIESDQSTDSYAICGVNGVTLKSGVSVTATGGKVKGSYRNYSTTAGLYSGNRLTVESGAVLRAIAGEVDHYSNSYGDLRLGRGSERQRSGKGR